MLQELRRFELKCDGCAIVTPLDTPNPCGPPDLPRGWTTLHYYRDAEPGVRYHHTEHYCDACDANEVLRTREVALGRELLVGNVSRAHAS